MKFSSILIVTYGRSGSTLLQGLLNSIEGCLVRGENYNFCYGLFEAYESLVKTKQEDYQKGQLSRKVEDPWYGASLFDENRFLADARKLVFHQLNPDEQVLSCIGFKEIRYVDKNFDPNKLQAYLDFLEKLFPNPAFIMLTRDHDQIIKSGWWQLMDSTQIKLQLDNFENKFSAYGKNKANIFSLDYSDIVERTQKLVAMFQFLGTTYNDNIVEKVLLTKYSYQPKKTKIKYNLHIEQIDYPFIQYAKMDELPLQSFTATGVIVLSSDINNSYTLIAVHADHEYQVNWNISSPIMAEKFSDNLYAKNARFRIDNLEFTENNEFGIYMKDDCDNKHLIFKIFLNS